MEEKEKEAMPVNEEVTAQEQAAAQVQAIMQQAEAKIQQLMDSMRQMDQMLRDKTIEQLFGVIKHSTYFTPEFVDKSAKCIETYLTNLAFSQEEEQDNKEK